MRFPVRLCCGDLCPRPGSEACCPVLGSVLCSGPLLLAERHQVSGHLGFLTFFEERMGSADERGRFEQFLLLGLARQSAAEVSDTDGNGGLLLTTPKRQGHRTPRRALGGCARVGSGGRGSERKMWARAVRVFPWERAREAGQAGPGLACSSGLSLVVWPLAWGVRAAGGWPGTRAPREVVGCGPEWADLHVKGTLQGRFFTSLAVSQP